MRFVFDFIILLSLSLSGYWIYVLVNSFFNAKNKNIKNTKLVRLLLIFFLTIFFITIFWGSFIEPEILNVKTTNINLNKTAKHENIRIILLTDTHVGPYRTSLFINRIAKKVDAQKPDLILLGGDYILGKEKSANYLKPLKTLAEKYPVYAVTGNHEFNLPDDFSPKFKDKTKLLRKLFADWNIKILDNETVNLNINNSEFNLSGIADIWTHLDDLELAQKNLKPNLPNILLSHNPDAILKPLTEKYDLILSGHTHGGQIRLPLIGPLPNLPTKLGRHFDKGLFKIKNTYLYISAGLGESGTRARLFNPPEISVLQIDL